MTNIRPGGAATVDLAVGNDLIVASEFNGWESAPRFPVNRSEVYEEPEGGRRVLLSVIWPQGGFVPLGAKRGDGSPHPAAGTGFAWSCLAGYPTDFRVRTAEVFDKWDEYTPERGVENPLGAKARTIDPNPVRFTHLHQYRFDGERFEVAKVAPLTVGNAPDFAQSAWGRGLGNAIPDGEDMLFPLVGKRRDGDGSVCGVARWVYKGGEWAAVAFTPVPGAEQATEPTLERGRDGRLCFTCRSDNRLPRSRSIVVWRSDDGGATWSVCVEEPDVRAASPVTINRAVDGTLFVLGNALNPASGSRERLAAWPLSEEGDRLLPKIDILDTTKEYGLFGGQYNWYVDHPVGSVVRLGDGKLRCVVTHRFANRIEVGSDLPPTPLTGTCLAEVLSDGEPVPRWRF